MVIDSNELLGHALGNCLLQRLLGRGGMGAVYLAQQARPRRQVAVKVLMPGILMETRSRAEFLTRFRREADAVAALDHINIMPVYEYGEQDDLAYIVMPYATGGTLRSRLEQKGKLPLDETLSIVEQAASALDCAHAQGIVHRDLKPGNILFHADGRVLLADFGLAKIIKDVSELDVDGTSAAALTSTGTIVGTPEYLSPEQGTGHPIDYRSDVYSLGVVLFHMLTGRVPFTGNSPVAVAIKHTLENPPVPSHIDPTIPSSVDAVILKALEKKPEQRYASAGEMAYALRTALGAHHNQPPATYYTQMHTPDEPAIPLILGNETVMETPPAGLNNDSTEESPRIEAQTQQELEQKSAPTTSQRREVPIEYQPTVIKLQTTATPPEAPIDRSLESRATNMQVDKQSKHGGHSLSMMFLGSIITLVLVIGGFISYLHFMPITHYVGPQATATATHKLTSSPTPYATPKAAIAAGQLLYATPLPSAACDHYGGTWETQTNASIKCQENGVILNNTGANHLAGIFLTKLPKGQTFPSDYIIQVQVSNISGNFGIYFRNQPASQLGGYAFLISSSGYWNGNVYDNQTGSANTLFGRQGTMPSGNTVTIDISVQGNTFQLYFDGQKQGGIQSGAYPNGTVGLVVDANSSATFQNFALYAA